MTLKKIPVWVMGAVFALVFVSCSKSKNDESQPPAGGGGSAGATAITINVYNMAFPASTTVKKGTTVKWYNKDNYAHTVTSNDGSTFSSGNLAAGATYSYTANKAGTFNYYCIYHSGMKGILIVTE